VKFMTEGPIVVMALEREDAIKGLREVMGATNPANAAEGTIRKRFARTSSATASMGRTLPRPRRWSSGSSSAPRRFT
jgi:nucleoside-diphosphate kinase